MSHQLPPLPYALDALEPYIKKQTLEFHYGKHHQAYVDNLNKLIAGSEFENAGLEDIIKKADSGIFNNAAQIWNHTFYFESLGADGGELAGEILDLIDKNFGNLADFKNKFFESAKTLFGSGWVWLVQKQDGSLDIMQTKNADSPVRGNLKPLLAIDVWEHAYYLDYKNNRPEYIEAWWNVVAWNKINQRINL